MSLLANEKDVFCSLDADIQAGVIEVSPSSQPLGRRYPEYRTLLRKRKLKANRELTLTVRLWAMTFDC